MVALLAFAGVGDLSCKPNSPHGPTIGGVIMLYGCP